MNEPHEDDLTWLRTASEMPNIIEHWRQGGFQQMRAVLSGSAHFTGTLSVANPDNAAVSASPEAQPEVARIYPDVLMQAAVVLLGADTSDGQIVSGISLPWFEIVSQLETNPDFLFEVPWRKLEELIAGAYQRDGWEVVLTPRSGDRGNYRFSLQDGAGTPDFH